ncbi:MAG: gfo/Idh/MocA family oxidoreductase [Shinella sp.]|nr:MAG: gfo/Idh/MocA family oxidoreductase [Shinella sp.]
MGTGTIATEQMVAAIRMMGHEPLWVVSRNKEYARFFSVDTGIPHTATDARRALLDPAVGFAYVSAVRDRRKHYVSAAGAARKHVLCDGPLSHSSRTANDLVHQCREAGVLLALNQPFRASTIHQTMSRLLREGEIGKLQSVVVVRGAPFSPPANRRREGESIEGDILFDLSVDDIDLARFLSGQEPQEVSVVPGDVSGHRRQQIAYSIRMTGEVIFQAYESFSTAEIESIVMLAGSHGTLIAHGTLNARGPGTLVRRVSGRNELTPVRERDPHHATIEEFLALRRRQSEWLCQGDDNVIALRAIEALAQADRKHRSIKLVGDSKANTTKELV